MRLCICVCIRVLREGLAYDGNSVTFEGRMCACMCVPVSVSVSVFVYVCERECFV